ncbi:hypothetical protein [Paenibacillus sp. CF384]|uniref:hypothetical protein n=1 Tax=Paenibacillus sp. CF384 TaxID=1884382 RepID=UPI0008957BE8|nr:hypothetical protein [Paenibacillus sp. CF384]SDX80831.1 hypothetical protein SAMN05518855_102276 [Paenibacillus sp. CF384]
MDRSSLKLMAAAMLLTAMLTGCGSQNDEQQPTNNGQAAVGGFSGGGVNQPDRTADFLAKVVKVSGDAIIVQKSTLSPADMPRGGGFGGGGGGRPNRDGQAKSGEGRKGTGNAASSEGNAAPADNGNAPQGEAPPTDGSNGAAANAPQGNAGADGAQGGKRQGGRFGGGGGFMNQMKFEDAQTTVAVDADTEIITMSRGQDGMTTNALKAADLKEGDILTVWLSSDNKTAQYISLRFNPGTQGKAGNGQ